MVFLVLNEGAIGASPEKLGPKKEGNACSDPAAINRDFGGESHSLNLMTGLA
jgi:hypothetical protein